jgi:hypothetical protein
LPTDDGYLLDHDFLFPERDAPIDRFALQLAFDPAWQPQAAVQERYTAEQVAPGRGFVLTLPLRYTGTGVPSVLDARRSPMIATTVWSLLAFAGIAVASLFLRERRVGRFAPLPLVTDHAWLHDHILKYRPEVVGAAWDEGIGTPEVVALIARMVREGTLDSDVKGKSSMSLRLTVDRNTLTGHERTLVERLFFNGRTQTTTELVKQHYRRKGFNPADEIRPELKLAVADTLPGGRAQRPLRFVPPVLFVLATILLFVDWSAASIETSTLVLLGVAAVVATSAARATGHAFRTHIDWSPRAAIACLLPAWLTLAVVATFLWFYAATDVVQVSPAFVIAVAAIALAVTITSINAMTSRQQSDGIAFRKRLAAGRRFFVNELGKDDPDLRDEWFPWLLAFGLGSQVDRWSTTHHGARPRTSVSTGSSSSSSSTPWTGFAGGGSGGAGGGASWTTAASGIAAGVAPPSSSGSAGSGSGGGSSSSGGSSGGGGGGGW